jgi:hypothetical protein
MPRDEEAPKEAEVKPRPEPVAETVAQAKPLAVKRPRGRPRKHPVEPGIPYSAAPQAVAAVPAGPAIDAPGPGQAALAPPEGAGGAALVVKRPRGRPRKHPLPDVGGIFGGVSVPGGGTGRPGIAGEKPDGGPAGNGGTAAGRPRGRRKKAAPSILNPFCPECGTYLRMFRPPRGRWRKVCPRCEPERMVVKRDYRDYIDKTGMPCKDRGKCRPERCVKALECEEMGRYR